MAEFIKIDRKILQWEWYLNINTKVVFLHCLLKANWKDGKWQGIDIKRGSFISSYNKIASETALSVMEVRTAFNHLKCTGEVTSKSHSKYTVFTVKNYDLYQSINKQNNVLLTNNQQTINTQLTTIEEVKKERKEELKNKKKKSIAKAIQEKDLVFFPDDEKLNKAFCDFVEMRNQIKKPMTDRAIQLAVKKLKELSAIPYSDDFDHETAIRILEQSIMNSWQGLFPLKITQNNQNLKTGIDWSNV